MAMTPTYPSATRWLTHAIQNHPTPALILNPTTIQANYQAIRSSIPGIEVFYAVKANPHPAVCRTLEAVGAGFEISSLAELELLLQLGVAPHRIISSNTIKAPQFLQRAANVGIEELAFDSGDELDKIARWAPQSKLYLRLTVDNSGSEWPLSRKHGADLRDVPDLLRRAWHLDLHVIGLTFHVGSQCLRRQSWIDALEVCRACWRAADEQGYRLRAINLGGGLPVKHRKPIPSLLEIGQAVSAFVNQSFGEHVRLSMEPGRALVGDAGTIVASVIGKATRQGERWLYLDVGVFNGLMETVQGFEYELYTERSGPLSAWTIAGPSCDSVDVMFTGVPLPELEVGDRVYILNAGAYTLSYASDFNGFGPPAVHLMELEPSSVRRGVR